MMYELLLLAVGVIVASFVGFNIGGSSTGVAFGPSTGAGLVSKRSAAALMTLFVFLGGWTVGRNVVRTMGTDLLATGTLDLTVSIVILFFIGVSLLLSNIVGVPASTSMTAVGALAGLGVARGALEWEVMGRIVSWWFVAPVVAFWAGAVMGRYLYDRLDQRFAIAQSDGPLVTVERRGGLPVPVRGPGTSRRELISAVSVLVIACFMAFSAGASNVANAVAPLVGSGSLGMEPGILLAVAAIGLGAFTIARRTLETVGSGITDMPILAALMVSVVSATIITILSRMGIPASLAISSTMCIAGLGWGRATRSVGVSDVRDDISAHDGRSRVREKAEEGMDEIKQESALFDPDGIGSVIMMWVMTPTISATASFLVFSLLL